MDDMQNKESKDGVKPVFKILTIEDTDYKTTLTEKFESRVKWEKPDHRKICSFLPGTLIKLNVKIGDKVKPGQPLLIFEAMKMMNVVKANQEGVIKDILVKTGDKFPKNQLLLEFE
jgi:biotin carboxyl carrier protein